ncbi:hypothetical protein GGX14DRAFT_559950 [Mycena pura]|uniref:Uncharacterized protein n=1 Tax=Mycena pura TaxID=153505 RepID=A0AAD6VQP8_9AGAR|nr:hypothetical protein GGX14DRAFT_559950 [Mycena pura]
MPLVRSGPQNHFPFTLISLADVALGHSAPSMRAPTLSARTPRHPRATPANPHTQSGHLCTPPAQSACHLCHLHATPAICTPVRGLDALGAVCTPHACPLHVPRTLCMPPRHLRPRIHLSAHSVARAHFRHPAPLPPPCAHSHERAHAQFWGPDLTNGMRPAQSFAFETFHENT